MKKIFMFLVLAVSFMACEGPEGPMGPMGHDGHDGMDGMDGRDGQNGKDGKDGKDGEDGKDGSGTNWFSKTFVIQPNEWKRIGNPGELNSYFIVEKKLPELTKDIYNEKAVIAYIQIYDGIKNGMPYVSHKGEPGSNDNEFLWTETYDFDYSEGWVGFYLTYSDFNTQIKPEDPINFHVILMW